MGKITQQLLEELANDPSISSEELRELHEIEPHLSANYRQWRQFLEQFLLSFGALSLVAGVLFFFAYNWSGMERVGKVAIALVLFLAAAGSTVVQKSGTFSWKIAGTTTALMVGIVLALLGQVYQTGADAWQLFFWWSVLAIPLAVIIDFVPLWMIVTITGQTALTLLYVQVVGGNELWIHGIPLTVLFAIITYKQTGSSESRFRLYRSIVGGFLAVWYTGITSYMLILYGRDGFFGDTGGGSAVINFIATAIFAAWAFPHFLTVQQNRAVTALLSAGIGWNLFLFLNHNLFGWNAMFEQFFIPTLFILAGTTFGAIKMIKWCDAHWEENK